MKGRKNQPRPIFVLGSPRSGTTLLGELLGSTVRVIHLGEYAGYYFCHQVASDEVSSWPAVGVHRYLAELREHAHEFPKCLAAEKAVDWFVVSAPWNLLVADRIVERENSAIFVICVREVRGVCQSLARSYASGWTWAGSTTAARIELWCRFYRNAASLPFERTIPIVYDHLCKDPTRTYDKFVSDLQVLGFPGGLLHVDSFATSHATLEDEPQPTVGSRAANGAISLHGRPAWDPGGWTEEDELALQQAPDFERVQRTVFDFVRALEEHRRSN